MDSAHLYLQVQESGKHLTEAIAAERELRLSSNENSAHAKCRKRLGTARHAVELAAERYALALRDFRLTLLAELPPAPVKDLSLPVSSGKRRLPRHIRGMARVASVDCRQARAHAEEGFGGSAGSRSYNIP